MTAHSEVKAQSNHSFVKFVVGVASIVIMIAISAMTVVKTSQAVNNSTAASVTVENR